MRNDETNAKIQITAYWLYIKPYPNTQTMQQGWIMLRIKALYTTQRKQNNNNFKCKIFWLFGRHACLHC